MEDCSFNPDRRRLLSAGAAAITGLAFGGCGQSAVIAPAEGPEEAAKIIPVRRRQTVYHTFTYLSREPLSPLDALDALGEKYQADKMSDGFFLVSIGGEEGMWIFTVDNIIPDRSGASVLTRLGKVPVVSAVDAQQKLANFSRGTIGEALSLANNGLRPTVTAVYRPLVNGLVRITIVDVGPLRLEA